MRIVHRPRRASTIAELTAVGRPAILIPLPIATDDHQAANARELAKAGGARVIARSNFNAKELAKQIKALADGPQGLGRAAHAAWCGIRARSRISPISSASAEQR